RDLLHLHRDAGLLLEVLPELLESVRGRPLEPPHDDRLARGLRGGVRRFAATAAREQGETEKECREPCPHGVPRIVRAGYRSGAGVYLGAAPPAPARFRAPGVKFARGGGRTRLPGKLAPEEGKHVMSVQDLELNCQVRAIVAKFWIDPNR